ncbi:SAP domain-containing protein [Rathayibacter sp. VKM Ac-2928]|uniref:SAP domain-containing protein n=1 Tax=Rathayibacter sp. VKM Ac-2928 TaxID=2929479 RepID=UPI001FB1FB97|nr:SAP domain-containing protein [Rathayibacter sp. VKM Ac-2928]MCJ1683255.1 SAP domain-containing protein [Rathayibacter sp. VKM Ac-2928]
MSIEHDSLPPSGEPSAEAGPPLDERLTEDELRRWYRLRDELAAFARARGVSASGPDGDRAGLLAAWQEYRALPADARPRA